MRGLLLASVLLLCACVSSRVAEANRDAVKEIASVAVAVDPANVPAANDAVATAEELVEATGWFAQVTNIGVPAALVDENASNVELLVAKVRGAGEELTPERAKAVRDALRFSDEISGRKHSEDAFKDATKSTPVGSVILSVLEVFGTAVGSIYGLTRGRKHIARWWATPPAGPVPPPPPPLPTDPQPAAPAAPGVAS